MSKDNARLAILNTLLSFPSINQKDWSSGTFDNNAMVGDLVSLCVAPVTKWYLSWVIDIKEEYGYRHWLLESIEDEEQCWWTNVGLNVYNRDRVRERPTWKWDDAQFSFWNRWLKVGKRNNAYIVLPVLPDFNENGSVTLDVRIRHSLNDYRNPTIFEDWKKLTMKDMDAYYKESAEAYNSKYKINREVAT